MVVRRSHASAWSGLIDAKCIDLNIGGAIFCFPAVRLTLSTR
jgi:hypothetical protein